MHRIFSAVIFIILAFFSLGVGGKEQENGDGILTEPTNLEISSEPNFPLDSRLKPKVQFWIDVYSKYSSWHTILHDKNYPNIIYGVVDGLGRDKKYLNAAIDKIQRESKKTLDKFQRRQQEILSGKLKLTKREERLWKLFLDIPGEKKFAAAAESKRMRRQGGLRDSLEQALERSARYLPRMERLFKAESVPSEIAYLPFVESSFNLEAKSKVGASGIWQLMPYTGREYLRVDDLVDERNDPIRAGEAAAKLLRQNYESLKSWPLAITAYNHGRLGLVRAVKSVGSDDLCDIIEKYDGPGFGFASANFYASFLGARHVSTHADYYIGKIPKLPLLEFDEFVMPDYLLISTIAKYLNISMESLKELNPALGPQIWNESAYVPLGYVLRLPLSVRDGVLSRYEQIPTYLKHAKQKAPPLDKQGDAQLTSIK